MCRLGAVDDCVVLVLRMVVLSQNDVSVFVVMVRRLFMFGQFKRVKYIRSETRNQINGRQYVAELESYIYIYIYILVIIVISNV